MLCGSNATKSQKELTSFLIDACSYFDFNSMRGASFFKVFLFSLRCQFSRFEVWTACTWPGRPRCMHSARILIYSDPCLAACHGYMRKYVATSRFIYIQEKRLIKIRGKSSLIFLVAFDSMFDRSTHIIKISKSCQKKTQQQLVEVVALS